MSVETFGGGSIVGGSANKVTSSSIAISLGMGNPNPTAKLHINGLGPFRSPIKYKGELNIILKDVKSLLNLSQQENRFVLYEIGKAAAIEIADDHF